MAYSEPELYPETMLNWHIEALALELKYTWKISRNASAGKINLFVRVSDGQHTGIGEAAPNIRYNEIPQNLILQFGKLVAAGLNNVQTLEELFYLLESHKPANALRFAVESAYVHFICQRGNLTVPEFLACLNRNPWPLLIRCRSWNRATWRSSCRKIM